MEEKNIIKPSTSRHPARITVRFVFGGAIFHHASIRFLSSAFASFTKIPPALIADSLCLSCSRLTVAGPPAVVGQARLMSGQAGEGLIGNQRHY